jgi:glyoxylase-like metal-dependent hydrolase (beta-lactamase superfamily II)
VTDVFLTHLHFDHCGGCIKKVDSQLVPAFPKARYWTNRSHWDWATHPNAREKPSFLKENILPMQDAGVLRFYDEGQTGFSGDISVRYSNGHTKSMMLPQVRYRGRTVVFMADLLPSAGHLPVPYLTSYDMFPLVAMEEKKAFLDEALENNYILFMQHDPVNECIDLQVTEKGIRMKTSFSLNEV